MRVAVARGPLFMRSPEACHRKPDRRWFVLSPNVAAYELRMALGRRIHLTNKETALLKFLYLSDKPWIARCSCGKHPRDDTHAGNTRLSLASDIEWNLTLRDTNNVA